MAVAPFSLAGKTALGTPNPASYIGCVSGFLRFIGVVNTAIWLGAGIFFAAVVLPAVFSPAMNREVFQQPVDSPFYSYYPGGVAVVLFRRFFVLQYICGFIGLLHLCAEKLYLGRAFPRLGTSIVVGALGLSLVGGIWLQPRMEKLRNTMYHGQNEDQKEKARHSFGMWHGISQFANLIVMAGLLIHINRVSRPPNETIRYGTFTKFRG
jgi:hypothetical protein